MNNVSQERLNDEQINQIADVMNDLYAGGFLSDMVHGKIEDLIVSHIAVNAELKRYKEALEEINKYPRGEALVYVSEIKEIANQALEGGSSK